MPRFIKKVSKTAGMVPGTLIHVGEKRTEKVKITVFLYNEKDFEEKQIEKIEDISNFKQTDKVIWINVNGLHDMGVIKKIGDVFGIHPLIQEDIVNTAQRPKQEDMGDYIFITLKMLYHDVKGKDIIIEQVSLILGANYVISFQEKEGDVFDPVRDRIKNAKGQIRKMGADYLAYSLVDSIVDNYFAILEGFGEKIEKIEEKLANDPGQKTLNNIHRLKRYAIFLRKSVWPLREVISALQRGMSNLIKDSTRIYFRDVYDHTIQVIDTIESERDIVSGMLDIYLSSLSNKLNEVMKVLAIFAAIFIPLTFVAGVYGMNFKHMPELAWRWGYFIALGLMAIMAISMIIFFKRKKWF